MIKLFQEHIVPIFVIVMNVALAMYTGVLLFQVMAAVIAALYLAKLWRMMKNRGGPGAA